MDVLPSIGLILLLALLAGHLVKFFRIPEVTGYILAGVALGPSVLGWISQKNVIALQIMSEVALGLILFSVGSVFSLSRFRHMGKQIVRLTFVESGITGLLVGAAVLAMGQPWQIAGLLSAISMSTAPAATLMVLREYNSRGPLTDSIRGIVAVNKVLVLTAFTFAAAAISLSKAGDGSETVPQVLYGSVHTLLWELLGSVALGYLIGLMLAAWVSRIKEHGEMQILLAGCILLCVGVALTLKLSPLLASLAVGATMVNLSGASQRLVSTLTRLDPPFYAIFFVIAGANLDIGRVRVLGPLGAMYVIARGLGKFLGARLGARWVGFDPLFERCVAIALLAQADLALGLSLEVSRRFPQYAAAVSTVVLGAVCVYELLGPIGTRNAILASGEAQVAQPAAPVAPEHA